MPQGPLLLNPNQLFSALQNEVYTSKIDEKLVSLENVRSLFRYAENPFYAGFGNKTNDANVYKTVNIDDRNIFIVNSNGEINERPREKQSYSSMLKNIETYFPSQLII